MTTQLISRKQIGARIGELRKKKGLSQSDLAKIIALSRPSLAQIELGNRSMDVLELQRLSIALGFSLDDFLSAHFSANQTFEAQVKIKDEEPAERISVPTLLVEKFKNVLLYILERCAGKPNVGETVLHQLLYCSDFNYYELYEEHLTGARYFKLPVGPVPQNFDNVVQQLIDESILQRVKTEYNHQTQMRYLPLAKADLTLFRASEKEVIDKVIDSMSDWSATSFGNYVGKDMPLLASKDGEEINYELVFYRDAPFSVRNYGEEIEEL